MLTNEPNLKVVSKRPYNASTPLPALQERTTPAKLTYVRNHFSQPDLELSGWGLELGGAVERPVRYSLSKLQAFPHKTLVMTLECAGNGRRSMDPQPPGTPWDYGAVSVVEVIGTSLVHVLEEVGLHKNVVEISFAGADRGEVERGRSVEYVRSLPLYKALNPDTLLVWAMGGEPLSPDHGFPLRLHVPGWYGMAAVKWLKEINALTEPFKGFFQDEHYVYSEEAGTPESEPVREIRVRSLITSPVESEQLQVGDIEIVGIAWSGSGAIEKVEVSVDGGGRWDQAELEHAPAPYAPQPWRYRWSASLMGAHTLCARAIDAEGQIQPVEQRWNRLGYGNNAVQKVHVEIRET